MSKSKKPSLFDLQMQIRAQAPPGWDPKKTKYPLGFMDKTPRAPRKQSTEPKKKKNKQEEHTLQTQIVKYLRTVCPDVMIVAGLTGELNGLSRHVPMGIFYGFLNKLKARGMLTGQQDLTLYWAEKNSVFIEVKWGDGEENNAQEDVRKRLTAMGFKCYVVWSLGEVQDIVKKENIPCRERFDDHHSLI